MTDSKSTTYRQLAMLELIPRYPDSISTREIAGRLAYEGYEISVRSVQRDLNKLSDVYGLESKNEQRSQFWYFPSETIPRMLPGIDDHTALSFLILQKHASALLPHETLQAVEPWFKKSAEKLSSRRGLTSKWHEKIAVLNSGVPRTPPKISSDVHQRVYSGILQEKCLRITYLKRGESEPREHIISPLGLVFKDIVQYLIANHENEMIVVFAMHRIKSAAIIDQPKFSLPSKGWINLKSYAENDLGYPLSNETYISLVAIVSGQTLLSIKESAIAADQSLTQVNDNEARLTATLPNTFSSYEWIRSRGSDITVIEPSTLRNELIQEAKKLLSQYNVNSD